MFVSLIEKIYSFPIYPPFTPYSMKKFLLIIVCISISCLIRAQEITIHHPRVVELKLEHISRPLRDLPQTPISELEKGTKRKVKDNPSLEHPIPILNEHGLPAGDDPAL